MLPDKLSNGLCSLLPNPDKYAFSTIFNFDKNFNIVSVNFNESIIKSSFALSYTEAQKYIENSYFDENNKNKKIHESLNYLILLQIDSIIHQR